MGSWKPYAVGIYRLGCLKGEAVAVWWEHGKRSRYRLQVRTEAEGRRRLDQFARDRTRLLVREHREIKALHVAYCEDRRLDGKSTDHAKWAWMQLEPHFGHLTPNDVDKAACKAYEAARLASGRKIGTIWTELTHLRTVLNFGEKAQLIDRAPHVWLPPQPEPRDRRLTREEAAKLIDSCDAEHVRLFVILALATAGRAEAILDLTWDRIDFERAEIDLRDPRRRENNKGRARVPMNGMARAALQDAYRGRTCEHVVSWSGAPVRAVKTAFRAAVRRSGLVDVSPHVLRHTAASWMAEAGVSMAMISQYLGHRRIDTTAKTYARFSPVGMRAAAEAVNLDLRRLVG